jgi:hypothetical protein
METHGNLVLVSRIFDTKKAWVETFISDDDTTSRAALKHCFKDKIKAGMIGAGDIPKRLTSAGRLVPITDNGRLPLYITPPTTFLADPNHRKKVYGKAFYNLISNRDVSVSKNDAEIMKLYFGYTQKQYKNESFDQFKIRFKAMFQHAFNVHTLCDSRWCPYHNNKELSDTVGLKKYKNIESKEYKVMKEIHDKHTCDKLIKMVHHNFSSQKNKALNKAISHVAPKHTTFSMTTSLKTRVSFVVCVDSTTYAETVTAIYNKLDLVINHLVKEAWKNKT